MYLPFCGDEIFTFSKYKSSLVAFPKNNKKMFCTGNLTPTPPAFGATALRSMVGFCWCCLNYMFLVFILVCHHLAGEGEVAFSFSLSVLFHLCMRLSLCSGVSSSLCQGWFVICDCGISLSYSFVIWQKARPAVLSCQHKS